MRIGTAGLTVAKSRQHYFRAATKLPSCGLEIADRGAAGCVRDDQVNIRVLIADPDEDLLRTYDVCLCGKGFEVATAADGPQCIARLRDFAPDVLLLEPDLPDGWGPRLLAEMRSGETVPCVPVIVLTRLDPLAATHPVCEYHIKPFSLAELAERIALVARGGFST